MRDLMDEEGENRALRTFLMQYGLPGLTVGAMESHMRRSGWGDEYMPSFAISPVTAGMHLTKAGAQIWIRHLLGLERAPISTPTEGRKRQSIDREWIQRMWVECNQDIFAFTREVQARSAGEAVKEGESNAGT